MKLKNKLALGFGSIVAIAAPVTAVVSCGSSNDSKSSTDLKAKFIAKDATKADSYDQVVLTFGKDSTSLKNILASLSVKDITDAKFTTALNTIEAELRTYADTLAIPNAPVGETIGYWAGAMKADANNALTIGTYPSSTAANAADDVVEIGINGLQQNDVIKFLKEAKPVLTGDAKTLWEAMAKEIKSL